MCHIDFDVCFKAAIPVFQLLLEVIKSMMNLAALGNRKAKALGKVCEKLTLVVFTIAHRTTCHREVQPGLRNRETDKTECRKYIPAVFGLIIKCLSFPFFCFFFFNFHSIFVVHLFVCLYFHLFCFPFA